MPVSAPPQRSRPPVPSPLGVAEQVAAAARKAALVPDRAVRMATTGVEPIPYEVVYRENKVELRHYEPAERRHELAVLLVYATVVRPYTFDLKSDRSVVRQFLDAGFEVYLLNGGEPSRLDRSLTLDDYVGRYLHNCVDAARDRADSETVHLLGYSTAAPLVAAYASLHPDRLETLALLGAPLDFDTEEGFFAFRALAEVHDPERVVEAYGLLPEELLVAAFTLRKPVEYFGTDPANLYDNFEDDEFVEHFARKLRWAREPVDVAGTKYRQLVDDLLEENRLVRGELVVDGDRVDPSAIELPVLVIQGADDKFVPPSSSLPFLDAVASDDTEIIEFPTGHVGMSVDGVSHREYWPRVVDWFEERSGTSGTGRSRAAG